MRRLFAAAIEDYLELCHLSWEAGLLSLQEWLDRLRFLRSMIPLDDPSRPDIDALMADILLAAEEEEAVVLPNPSFASTECNPPPDDGMLHFNPDANTGLSKYFFLIGDPDDEPSIPHGHFKRQKQPKLDPYLGRVYKNKLLVWTEPKAYISALWNDAKWRVWAKNAIIAYMTSFPKHRWRVRNPLRLPRKRRP